MTRAAPQISGREAALAALRAVLGPEPGIAVLHSSLAALAPPVPLGKWDMLYALGRLVQEGWTFALPSFTFSFCGGQAFSPDSSPSETGILADWALDGFAEAIRSAHPIYSFVLIGPRRAEIAACDGRESTFGAGSPFALFEAENAHIVMFGAGWEFCTYFHRSEELAAVPYRYLKTFKGDHLAADGTAAPTEAAMFVRDLQINAANDFSPYEAQMRAAGLIVSADLWRARVEAARAQDLSRIGREMLTEDPLAFVAQSALVRDRINLRDEAARTAPYKVALLGASNLDIAGNLLDAQLAEWMPGRRCELYVPPYGQMAQEILLPGSGLADFAPEMTIFADRLEDLAAVPALELADPEKLADAVATYAGLIRQWAEQSGGDVIVHRFALAGALTTEQIARLGAQIAVANAHLDEALAGLDRVIWVDPAAEAARTGGATFDARLWHIGRIPFAQGYAEQLARRWSAIILSLLGKTARLIVLDLDHTLWGGVLGEDGPEGIAIGGDFPGNAFAHFQRLLKTLSDSGVALAVSSKNDEDLALGVLRDNPNMVIRADDLVSHRIGWNPKWQGIQEMAAELSLGLASVLFIDDNPVEREQVRRNLPAVKVLDLPADPTDYARALQDCPWIETVRTGQEDRNRVASYKARSKIAEAQKSAASIESFLAELDMTLFVQPLDGDNIARAAQLCQKTNQFNTTTRRHSARDLEEMVAAGADVAVIGLADKYSARENIGLIVLRPEAGADGPAGAVDIFLLSCRVLGRGIEGAVLEWAIGRAAARGWGALTGEIIETPRNTPARKVFADAGFTQTDAPGQWRHEARPAQIPEWFCLDDSFSQKGAT